MIKHILILYKILLDMKQKKITIMMSYDYDDCNTASNEHIAYRIGNDLRRGLETKHEKIDSVVVEDVI